MTFMRHQQHQQQQRRSCSTIHPTSLIIGFLICLVILNERSFSTSQIVIGSLRATSIEKHSIRLENSDHTGTSFLYESDNDNDDDDEDGNINDEVGIQTIQSRDRPIESATISKSSTARSSMFATVDHMIDRSTSISTTRDMSIENKDDSSSCLRFDSENIDDIIAKSKQIFITMPAKAAGTSIKNFVQQCITKKNDRQHSSSPFNLHDNFLNNPNATKEFLTSTLDLPKIIASHSLTDQTLVDLIQHSSRGTLMIHVYRDETDRLISGIKEVINLEVCRWTPRKAGISRLNLAVTSGSNGDNANFSNGGCMIGEDDLVEMIESRQKEIGFGNPETLTCRLYDAIDDNAPNMIFMHYKQANQLQTLLAKHHCPELQDHTSEINTAESKHQSYGTIYVQLKHGQDGELKVTLDRWLEAKANLLEWTLKLKGESTCQRRTREIEDKILSCEDQIIQI